MLSIERPEALGLCSQRLTRVSDWLKLQVSSERLAGASVLIGRHGQPAFFEATGWADAERRTPFTQDTIVRIYSMTKPVTSVAAMMLYEQGAFQLDDPLYAYLPEFRDVRVWAGGEAPIDQTSPAAAPMNVRQVMTHTAGLTYGFMQTNVVDAAYRELQLEFPGGPLPLEESVRRLAELPLICQPGTAWNYSVATDVLGRLVEVWSGQSLEAYMQQHIFEPLAMNETGFHVHADHAARLASCYAPKSGKTLGGIATASDDEAPAVTGFKLQDDAATSAFLQPAKVYSGGGGLTSTVGDYARFCQMLLNQGALDGERLLGRKTVGYMRQNQLPDHRDMAAMGQPVWSETSYDGIGFGLGFAVVIDPVKAAIVTSPGEYHWGGAASTFFWLDPEEDLYTIFLTQLLPSSTYPIRRELRTRVYQALVD